MKTLQRTITGAALVLLASSLAHANSIVQTLSTPSTATQWSSTYAFNQFDTALGTLNSISLSITDSLSGTVTITNNSGASGSFKGTISAESWFSTDASLLTQNGANPADWLNQPGGVNVFLDDTNSKQSGFISITNGSGGTGTSSALTNTSTTGPGDPNSSFGLTDSLFYSLGGGTTNLYELVAGTSSASGPSPNSSSSIPLASTTITLTYDYAPATVPEPATLALMGGALIGLGLLGKRFKKG